VSKIENRLRRLHDRRRVHVGRRSPASVAEATSAIAAEPNGAGALTRSESNGRGATQTALLPAKESEYEGVPEVPEQRWDPDEHLPGRIVREKSHPAEPMTVDQALYKMELVGHDFYLFNDTDSGQPSVVYRRRAFDYGVIRLA